MARWYQASQPHLGELPLEPRSRHLQPGQPTVLPSAPQPCLWQVCGAVRTWICLSGRILPSCSGSGGWSQLQLAPTGKRRQKKRNQGWAVISLSHPPLPGPRAALCSHRPLEKGGEEGGEEGGSPTQPVSAGTGTSLFPGLSLGLHSHPELSRSPPPQRQQWMGGVLANLFISNCDVKFSLSGATGKCYLGSWPWCHLA